jgi:hypothetical protein
MDELNSMMPGGGSGGGGGENSGSNSSKKAVHVKVSPTIDMSCRLNLNYSVMGRMRDDCSYVSHMTMVTPYDRVHFMTEPYLSHYLSWYTID